MLIDARNQDIQDILVKLKEIMSSKIGCEVSMEIISGNLADAKKIKAFITMSGCKADIKKDNSDYQINIHGCPCCV